MQAIWRGDVQSDICFLPTRDRQPSQDSSQDHDLSEAVLGVQVTCQWWSWSACCCSEMSCQCLELTRWGIGLLWPCRACSQAGLCCWKSR